ncbi:GntR family transcriptional regulator [Streptomyces aidingensis]|uniref:GntR family transcriptional regulator n=1 Tax=Streptomyces aidingensis TaxID=910347 RepID=A0A1I1PV04_9ACTN|nr:GntR family transcriptional regulator [Streptomyces aidingensis]SFD13764.1 GntR family transcriptional regulator [Streptomyces aidingensis]
MAGDQRRKALRHEAIAADLSSRIASGGLRPGQKLPSEKHLMEHYDVSRTTLRQALDNLRATGLIESRQGAGITVRAFRPIRRSAAQRLSQEVWGEGKSIWDAELEDRPWRVDVEVDEVVPPPRVARIFESDGPVCRRSRHFYVEDKPVQHAVSYLPASLVAGTQITQRDTGPGGVYARLAEIGRRPTRFREEVRARMPSVTETAELSLSPGTPVFDITRIAADDEGRPVEVNEMLLDGGSYILDYVFSA